METKNEISASATNKKGKNGFKNNIVAVIALVKRILIRTTQIYLFNNEPSLLIHIFFKVESTVLEQLKF